MLQLLRVVFTARLTVFLPEMHVCNHAKQPGRMADNLQFYIALARRARQGVRQAVKWPILPACL